MAYAILNSEKFKRAEVIVKKEGGDIVEVYKKLGGSLVEGTNEEVERTKKYTAIFDEAKKDMKKSKKLGKAKGKKK